MKATKANLNELLKDKEYEIIGEHMRVIVEEIKMNEEIERYELYDNYEEERMIEFQYYIDHNLPLAPHM